MSDPNTVTAQGATATILVALLAYTTTGIDDFCICVMYNGMAANDEMMTYQNVRLGFFFSFFLIMTISCGGLFFGAVIPGGYVQLLGFLPFLIGVNQMARMIYIKFFQKKKDAKISLNDENSGFGHAVSSSGVEPSALDIESPMSTMVMGESVDNVELTTPSTSAQSSTKSEASTAVGTDKSSSNASTEDDDHKNNAAHGFFIRLFLNFFDPRTLEVAAVTFSTNVFFPVYTCQLLQ